MAIWDPPTEIGLLIYPDVASATVHGLTDLFTVASTLARERIGAKPPWYLGTYFPVENPTIKAHGQKS
jgi:hypothetical protein